MQKEAETNMHTGGQTDIQRLTDGHRDRVEKSGDESAEENN